MDNAVNSFGWNTIGSAIGGAATWAWNHPDVDIAVAAGIVCVASAGAGCGLATDGALFLSTTITAVQVGVGSRTPIEGLESEGMNIAGWGIGKGPLYLLNQEARAAFESSLPTTIRIAYEGIKGTSDVELALASSK